MGEGCFICTKHRTAFAVVPGGAILADEHAVVSHLPLTTPTLCAAEVDLGHLLVEVRRHVGGLEELTPDEAASLGRLAAAGSRALRRGAGAARVDATVDGDAGGHLQLHLIARYPGAPPRGDAAAVVALADRLRRTAQR